MCLTSRKFYEKPNTARLIFSFSKGFQPYLVVVAKHINTINKKLMQLSVFLNKKIYLVNMTQPSTPQLGVLD